MASSRHQPGRAPPRPRAHKPGASGPVQQGKADPNLPLAHGGVRGRAAAPPGPAPRPQVSPAPEAVSPSSSASPFARYAPDERALEGASDGYESNQILAIVAGLSVTVGAAAVVLLAVLGVAVWIWLERDPNLVAANDDDDEPAHITDTDVAPEIVRKRRAAAGPVEPVEAAPMAPTTADAVILIPKKLLFHSVEVNCPSGIRERARFIGLEARVRNLPISEECVVTFQGSQPAVATISGGQTKTCTFAPTRCVQQ